MDLEKIMDKALNGMEIPVKYWEYQGKEKEYITFNEADETAAYYEDNAPVGESISFQVHFFCPKSSEKKTLKKVIKSMLIQAGVTIRGIATAYEKETKTLHIIYDCTL